MAHGAMTIQETTDAQIEFLLATDEETSVVDALMAMPRIPAAAEEDVWHKALHAHLQKRLSRKLRAAIGRQRGNGGEDGATQAACASRSPAIL